MTAGLPIDTTILLVAGLLVVGILVVGISDRLRLPASLLSLALGMVIGSDVLGWVYVDDAALVRDISVIALIIILFEGGLTTKPSALREAGLPGFALSTVGVAVTAAITALAVQLVFSTGWQTALLLGAVVASTDAAVVFDLLRRAPLPRRLSEVLEVESGANDPFAIVLTIGLLQSFSGDVSVGDWAVFGVRQLVVGATVGLGVGALGVLLLRLDLRSQGLYPLVALGVAGLAYSLAATLAGSGFLAVYLTGLVIGAFVPRHRRVIRSFHASLANGADIGLFLMLGLLVFPSRLGTVAGSALVVTAILVIVARPVAVAVAMAPFGFSWREQVVLSWAGLRGAVPIVLATFPLTAGVPDGQTIFDVVFFVVVTSTLVQGTTTVPLVRWLGLESEQPAWRSIAEALPLDSPDIDLAEVVIAPELGLAGASLRDRPPGAGIRVIAVLRGENALLPAGDTVLEVGDTVLLAIDVRRAGLTDVTAWARGETVEDDSRE